MIDDTGTDSGIRGGIRRDTGRSAARHRQRGVDPRVCLGDLDHGWQLSGVAGRPGQPVRPAVGDSAREHRVAGARLLSALILPMSVNNHPLSQRNTVSAHCCATLENAP